MMWPVTRRQMASLTIRCDTRIEGRRNAIRAAGVAVYVRLRKRQNAQSCMSELAGTRWPTCGTCPAHIVHSGSKAPSW